MALPLITRNKTDIITACLFVGLFFAFAYAGYWWPGIIIAIGCSMALRQYLRGRPYDVALTFVIFVGLFISLAFDLNWNVIIPVIFTLGAFYILGREFLTTRLRTPKALAEDLKHEIENSQHEE